MLQPDLVASIERAVDPKEWDLWVSSSRERTLFQATLWADALQAYLPVGHVYFIVHNLEGCRVAQLLAFREGRGARRALGWRGGS